MKRLLKYICVCAVMLMGLGMLCLNTNVYSVKAEDTATESKYAKVWSNDLGGFAHSGATRSTATNNVSKLVSGGRFGYATAENVEVSTIVEFTSINGGNVNFHLRMTGNIPDANYTSTGYHVRWYSHGQFEFLKNGSKIINATAAPIAAPNTSTDYTVVFSTINWSDGSVKVKLTINDAVFVDYTDSTDPITGAGYFAVTSDGFVLSATGNGFTEEAVWLGDMANPHTNANFPGTTINSDKTVTISDSGIAGGASWAFQQSDWFTYKYKFTPSAKAGKLRMTMGSAGTLHRFDVMGDDAWNETGYVFQWWSSGQFHIFRNKKQLKQGWSMSAFTANKTYEVEYGVKAFDDGSNRVHIKVDGAIKVIFFDNPTSTNTPAVITKTGVASTLLRHALIQGEGLNAVVDGGTSNPSFETKTLLTSDLGQPAKHSGATFDRNGGIAQISSGRVAGYNGNFKNTVVKFDANLKSLGSMILQLRGQASEYDTPWGNAWTNKGYAIYIFTNGQTLFTKNSKTICDDGWSLSSQTMSTNTNYTVEFGTINVTDSYVRIYATINGKYVINYLDNINALNNSGWFTIFNNQGLTGSLMPYGVEYPEVTTNLESGENAVTGREVTLSYNLSTADSNDEVTYYINQDASTAQATITGNKLVATQEGAVSIYVCVNGVYSNDIFINVEAAPTPQLISVPSTITFGSENVVIDAKLSDNSIITTKTFGIVNVSGEALINETTGEITPQKAGTIKVFAYVDGVKTEEALITILPVVTITEPSQIIRGGNVSLQYTTNCDLPTETITAVWEVVSGQDVAQINESTGALTLLKGGEFSVKVKLIGETFETESQVLTLNVATPVITNLPTIPLIVGGQTWVVDAKLDNDGTITTKTFGIVNVSGDAQINETTGEITAVKAGTIKVYALVNGCKTDEHIISISPKVFIHKEGSFAFGGVYDLNEYYSSNCQLPNEQIVVTFEIVSGEEYATLNTNTGVLTVGTTPGIVGLKVYVTGETFQAVSAVTNISVEKPIVVIQNGFLDDLYVGQSVTLNPIISQGGVEIESAQIVAVSGGDCVSINGLTITATKPGTLKYKVIINETIVHETPALEIAIENLIPTIIANNEMVVEKTQQAEVLFNANNFEYTTLEWSVVSGQNNISVSSTGLITALNEGNATIKVVVDNLFEATLNITVYGKVVLVGVAQNASVLVGGEIQLNYRADETLGEITTVEYVVVSGGDNVSITENGKVNALNSGTVKVKVVVNGVESQIVTFNIYKNEPSGYDKNKLMLIIVLSSCGGLLLIGGATIGVVLAVKSKKAKKLQMANNSEVENNKQTKNNKKTTNKKGKK